MSPSTTAVTTIYIAQAIKVEDRRYQLKLDAKCYILAGLGSLTLRGSRFASLHHHYTPLSFETTLYPLIFTTAPSTVPFSIKFSPSLHRLKHLHPSFFISIVLLLPHLNHGSARSRFAARGSPRPRQSHATLFPKPSRGRGTLIFTTHRLVAHSRLSVIFLPHLHFTVADINLKTNKMVLRRVVNMQFR